MVALGITGYEGWCAEDEMRSVRQPNPDDLKTDLEAWIDDWALEDGLSDRERLATAHAARVFQPSTDE